MASGIPEEYVYKNRLQQLSQRLFTKLPVFETPNEGSQHDPKFRPTVVVDGIRYISPQTFNRRKDAEQYVSKVTLEQLFTKLKKEGFLQISSTSLFCKSILHEYAIKKKMAPPVYTTTSNMEGMLPMFKTFINFNGNTFDGGFLRNKKDAEQTAARSAILWILGQPDDISCTMAEIIKLKEKLFNETHVDSNLALVCQNNPPLQIIVSDHLSDTANKENDMLNASTNTQVIQVPHVAQETHAPLKVATAGLSGDSVAKAVPQETLSLSLSNVNGMPMQEHVLPVSHVNVMPLQVQLHAHTENSRGAAVVNLIPPASEELNGKLMANEIPVQVSGGPNVELKPSKSEVNPVSMPINPVQVPVHSCPEQTVQIKVEEASEVNASTLSEPSPSKRSRKKNRKGAAKKARMS